MWIYTVFLSSATESYRKKEGQVRPAICVVYRLRTEATKNITKGEMNHHFCWRWVIWKTEIGVLLRDRWSRGGTFFIRRFIDLHRGTGAHKVLVTVDVVDP